MPWNGGHFTPKKIIVNVQFCLERELCAVKLHCAHQYPLYQTPNIDFAGGDGEWHGYANMSGLFVYDGELAGVYSRQAQGNAVIASYRNERTIPTYYIQGDRQ